MEHIISNFDTLKTNNDLIEAGLDDKIAKALTYKLYQVPSLEHCLQLYKFS